jgi:hypothetical protein
VPLLPGWHAELHLEADDTRRFAWTHDGIPLSASDAAQIVPFVAAYVADARALVVACDAGISRSHSVAAALAHLFALPYQWTVFEPVAFAAVLTVGAAIRRDGPAREVATEP